MLQKVLWISRHSLVDKAIEDLKTYYGDIELYQLDETISNFKSNQGYSLRRVSDQSTIDIETNLYTYLRAVQVVCCVLPHDLLYALYSISQAEDMNFEILLPQMQRVLTKDSDSLQLQFLGWKRLDFIDIKLSELKIK